MFRKIKDSELDVKSINNFFRLSNNLIKFVFILEGDFNNISNFIFNTMR